MIREISKEIYDKAKNGVLPKEDYDKVFTISELCGYGVYLPRVFTKDGKYYISFELGSSCD